ncbi:MAG: methyltransferase domain-containing protein [Bacteroidota bacterium]
MSSIRKKLRKFVPLPIQALHWKYFKSKVQRFENKTTGEVFSEIYKGRYWGDDESVSGVGSSKSETENISLRLPELLSEYRLKSMLDIPCGDFYWMKDVNRSNVNYIGADIVQELADENNRKYQKPGIQFTKLDITIDLLPEVDLIFCRDCLVHLAEDKVFAAITNIKKSGSKYLLTTTHTERSWNREIITGDWRPLNLEAAPFNFPKPIYSIPDSKLKETKDKVMALWRIKDLPTYSK